MENNKTRIIYNEKQLFDHFLQKTIESIFDIPTQGRNTFDSNKVTLENELDKYTSSKISNIEKNHVLTEMNKIIARIQDFSVVDLNDPQVLMDEQASNHQGKEEIIASRYNIQITASDLKRITNSNWFNTKLVDFYTFYLTEKLSKRPTHIHLAALPSMFFNPLNPHDQSGEIYTRYQEGIEHLIRKAQEIKKGEQNIFKLVDRLFFVANLIKTHWVIIEVQKSSEYLKNTNKSQVFTAFNYLKGQAPVLENKAKYQIILYDSMHNYVKPDEHMTLRSMRTFLIHNFRKWGGKIDENDFELLYAETAKQNNMLDSGAYICKFLDILYQGREQHNSAALSSVKPLDMDYFKNELKDLIQMIGFKSVLPESVLSRF